MGNRLVSLEELSQLGWGYKGNVADHPELLERVRTGALLRCATALEEIERHLHALTPAGQESGRVAAERQREAHLDREAIGRIGDWLDGANLPRGLKPWKLARWAVVAAGRTADPTCRTTWELTLAAKRLQGFGVESRGRLKEWVDERWPPSVHPH